MPKSMFHGVLNGGMLHKCEVQGDSLCTYPLTMRILPSRTFLDVVSICRVTVIKTLRVSQWGVHPSLLYLFLCLSPNLWPTSCSPGRLSGLCPLKSRFFLPTGAKHLLLGECCATVFPLNRRSTPMVTRLLGSDRKHKAANTCGRDELPPQGGSQTSAPPP